MACRLCENEWAKTAADICTGIGHDPTTITRGRLVKHERDGQEHAAHFEFPEAPDETRCTRCHARLPSQPRDRREAL
jgi:uncharacterized paraquat-inducible protein A